MPFIARCLLLLGCTFACSKPDAVPGDLVFTGMCDASAGVPLDTRTFLVADDEDNVLRAYDALAPGAPLWSVDVSAPIGVSPKPAKPGKGPPETDIEAATRLGDLALWMTSHGRNSSGKLKRERLKLFATRLPKAGAPLAVSGQAYEHLLDDLLAEPQLARFGLKQAAELAPKAPGGLNLEGMTARREGGVWIGFRNPIPEGKALLVPLLNPERVLSGEKATFGVPISLDLGGRGVRAISSHRDRYLILAGSFDSGDSSKLYSWDGVGRANLVADRQLAGLNPEGFFTPPGGARVLLLSDDGSVLIDGTECKRLSDPSKKRFRARFVKL
ncbi:MAG TPA: DUF3616 domain-containing protein [Polyangiaceae bacterium]|nr:DUF3616 domain-containing protein [Polyangiaceae bacterium]